MDFFKVFLNRFNDAVFFFITKEDKEEIMKVAEKKGIPANAIRIESAERHQVPLYLSASDYSLFFIKPAFSKKASSPTKQGEIMAMGIPVICNDNVGDTSVIVNRYASGVVVTGFADEAYKEKINQLVNIQFDPQQIRKGAKEFFSLENGIDKYALVYEKMLN